MSEDRVLDWIASWFVEKSGQEQLDLENNFFELDYIDSFGVIELIEDLEYEFNIIFNQEDFQDRRFSSIDGLADIVVNKSRL